MSATKLKAGHRVVALIALAVLVIGCGQLGGTPPQPVRTYPADAVAKLDREAVLIRSIVDEFVATFPESSIALRKQEEDAAEMCLFEDGDDPNPGQLIKDWTYRVYLNFSGPATGEDGLNARLIAALRADGWRIGWDFTDLGAVKDGRYLEILMPARADFRGFSIRGQSRCVAADGTYRDKPPENLTAFEDGPHMP